MRIPYPFSAIVGQDEMKLALILSAIDPSIGGVLIFGDRGTGKSTAIRGLAALLPKVKSVVGCRFNCDPAQTAALCPECKAKAGGLKSYLAPIPVVDLPLGVTEDRVVGSLDFERALSRGERAFEPGLLARAHRGFLYIDEVNLLEDHIVDLLLDVAASGENVVEREGLSLRHAASFVLIGSGNPEEGELRPQLLDRFGLSVDVKTPTDRESRIEVIRRRDAFEREPEAFLAQWRKANETIARRISRARRDLNSVQLSDAAIERATTLCMSLGADGLRGELTLIRASRALAAFDHDGSVEDSHLRRVAASCFRHRMRRNPLDDAGSSVRIERALEELMPA
jgi:magnesium chelatase subunit I